MALGMNMGRKEPGVLFAPHHRTLLNFDDSSWEQAAWNHMNRQSGWEVLQEQNALDTVLQPGGHLLIRLLQVKAEELCGHIPGLPCFSAL